MFSNNILFDAFGIFIATLLTIVAYFKWKYSYWKNLGVPIHFAPEFPFGNVKDSVTQKKNLGEYLTDLYQDMKSKKHQYGGCYFFNNPWFIPIDLELIKRIMQTDFQHFTDHGAYVNEKHDPLTAHLFALEGQRWRNLRVKLTPTFTSGKIKNMLPIVIKISEELLKVLKKETENNQPIDAKDVSARFTTDVIGNCAFGIDCSSLADADTEFRKQGKRLFNLSNLEVFRNFMIGVFPEIMKFFGATLFPKVATRFFSKVIKDTTEYREQNKVRRSDFLQLLIELKNSDIKENSLTFDEVAAQAFVFYLGGFETSSTLMCFALYELSRHEEVQNKLRDEINAILIKNNGEFTYEGLNEMHYADSVINETLRKYPPFPATPRKCTKDYNIPNTDIILRKGTQLFLPIRGIHYDPEFYPNPEKFDPDRFNEENKNKRHQFAFIPFGEGPRLCIGLRFAMMQAKIGLATITKNFYIKVNPKTESPVKLDPKNFLTNPAGNLWLNLEKIN